jgi:hypothetical protein
MNPNLRIATNKFFVYVAAAVLMLWAFFFVASVAWAAAPVLNRLQGFDPRPEPDDYNNTQAIAGQFLVLWGSFAPSGNVVLINGSPAAVIHQSTTQLNVQLTGVTGNIDVEVKNSEGASAVQSFRIVPDTAVTPTPSPTGGAGASAECSKLEQNFVDFGGGVPGPLANNCYSPGQAVNRAIRIAFILVGMLTVLAIVIGGYRYIMSRGDPKAAEAGKNAIKWGIIGLIVVLLAYMIVTVTTRLITTNQLF